MQIIIIVICVWSNIQQLVLINLHFTTACNCDVQGSLGSQCNQALQCSCKPNIEGLKCDRCAPGRENFPTCSGMNK